MFKTRKEAGRLLLAKLKNSLSGRKELANVVVALPRGGVPVASEIAVALKAPLTVLVSKKIGAPFQPEYAIGAVSSTGVLVRSKDDDIPEELFSEHMRSEAERLSRLTKEQETRWLESAGLTRQLDFNGKRVILVDDGVATGMTTIAAAISIKQLGAAEIIIASPVIAAEAKDLLLCHCDLIVAVTEPYDLGAIGLFYEDFHQVCDDEVREALSHCAGHA